jgi:hypothetical protein
MSNKKKELEKSTEKPEAKSKPETNPAGGSAVRAVVIL